ncbi:hypothetical protein Tco_0852094 [Tanacetum coccineum]
MEMPNTGLIIASAYNRVVISLANGGNVGGCSTTFPLWSNPSQSEPHETIVIANVYGNHFIKAALHEGFPLPMFHPLWRTYKSDTASKWEDPYVSIIVGILGYLEKLMFVIGGRQLIDCLPIQIFLTEEFILLYPTARSAKMSLNTLIIASLIIPLLWLCGERCGVGGILELCSI